MSTEITRQLLQTAPVEGLPGWETRLFLITCPAGADGSGHAHPVPGIGYVLEGTMVSAFDDDAEETILAGPGFQDKASVHRVIRNGSPTDAVCDRLHGEVRRAQYNVARKAARHIRTSRSSQDDTLINLA